MGAFTEKDERYWNFKLEHWMLEKNEAFKLQNKNYFSLKDNS